MYNLIYGQVEFSQKIVNIPLFIIRFYTGFTIMSAGLDKLPLTDWMIEQVTDMGFPYPFYFAWMASFGEFAFGLLLLFGFMTRISGVILAIIMGIACFGFHQTLPLVDMHITQGYFWVLILFTFIGAGKYSLDSLITEQKYNKKRLLAYLPVIVFLTLLSFGIYLEKRPKDIEIKEPADNSSILLPDNLNIWDPECL